MNVIISNKNESVLMSLGIDVIKTLNGVFTVDDLAATFKNFYYNGFLHGCSNWVQQNFWQ